MQCSRDPTISRPLLPSCYALSILNTLSNIDKHEAIHLTEPRSANMRFAFHEKGSDKEACVLTMPLVFDDRTEAIICNVPPGKIRPGMDVKITGMLFVSFKESGPWGDVHVQRVLEDCLTFLKESVFVPRAPFTK
jgi:hypothetical protein